MSRFYATVSVPIRTSAKRYERHEENEFAVVRHDPARTWSASKSTREETSLNGSVGRVTLLSGNSHQTQKTDPTSTSSSILRKVGS
jgi:hypothetical protein